jgi:PAS domain S-box-containing protein
MFHARSVSAYASLLQWEVLFVYTLLVPMIWFVYVRLGTARRWLAGIISLIWTMLLVINFASPGSLVYLQIDTLVQHETYLGESFAVALGTPNPWNELANLGVLLIIFYTLDAALRSWRQGVRLPAVNTGGSIVTFLLFAGIQTMLVDHGVIATPYTVSFSFLAIVAALSYELVANVVHVRHYEQQLALGEERWQIFLANVELAVVEIDAAGNINFVNPFLEHITGYTSADLIGRLASDLVAPAERKEFASRLQEAFQTGPRPRSTWTLLSATGEPRKLLWSTVRINHPDGSPAGIFSIGEDITEQLKTQMDLHNAQREMERLARANMLGELTSALAHELNQPLTAILSNAQAARRFMQHAPPDMEEVREIIDDIIHDDKHAGHVIHSLRVYACIYADPAPLPVLSA